MGIIKKKLNLVLKKDAYPFQKDGIYGTNIVLRGTDPNQLEAAKKKLQQMLIE